MRGSKSFVDKKPLSNLDEVLTPVFENGLSDLSEVKRPVKKNKK